MTREKLIDYIDDFKFYKRELMAGTALTISFTR